MGASRPCHYGSAVACVGIVEVLVLDGMGRLMRTWSLESAVSDACAVVRYTLSLTLSPILDWVYPSDERWEWPPDGSEALNNKEAEDEVAESREVPRACNLCVGWGCTKACEQPNEYEPQLSDDELVAVRCLLTAADGTSFATLKQVVEWWHERCDESSAAVADDGLGGMSDAEPPPGPGSPAVSDIPPSPAGEHLSDGDCFDYCVGHPEDEPHQVDPATYTTAEAFQSAANILEDLRREHTNVWLDPQMYDLRGFIGDLYSRAAAFRRAESKLGGVDWATDTYPQHRGQR